MLEKLLKMYKIEKFFPLYDYIRMLDKEDVNIIDDGLSHGVNNRTIKVKINDLMFKILVLADCEKKWISFNRYNQNNENIEMIDFLIYDKDYIKNSDKYNRFVRYSAIKYEGEFATTINYTCSYIDNVFISGWQKKRVISYEDGHALATKDNLANLSCHIERSGIKTYEEYDENIDKVKKLEFFY